MIQYRNKIRSAFTALISVVALSIHAQTPTISFAQDINNACIPMTVSFTNTTSNATSYYWDFGNGNTSSLESPTNVYLNTGSYTIKLIATNSGGVSDSVIMVGAVNAIDQPVAGYYTQNTSSCLDGNAINFVNTTTQSVYWLWDFGDGYTSTDQNPIHTYDFPGTYSVILMAGNTDSCENLISKPGYITIYSDWDAIVTVNDPTVCDINHVFQFGSPSLEIVSWLWDFGDGVTSTSESPTHIYSTPGNHTVTLSTSNANGCTDVQVLTDFIAINIGDPGVISATETNGCKPFSTSFGDSSSSSLSWFWDFGDGTTDTARYPSHTYANSGVYDVSLTVTNGTGCNIETTIQDFVNVQLPPKANFKIHTSGGCLPVSAYFVNKATNATSWNWNFGDGVTSTQERPIHTYTTPGNFTVTLDAYSNSTCMDSKTELDAVQIPDPIANFSVSNEQGCVPFQVAFYDSSLNATQWLWTFDDGTTSTLQNPIHQYLTGGSFNVSLVVGNSLGCTDTVDHANPIEASLNSPPYVTPPPYSGCAPFDIGFEDNTPGALGWAWNYGDGSDIDTSRVSSHTFTSPGSYTVSLFIESFIGCDQYIPNYATIVIGTGNADFTYNPDICDPTLMLFTDSSTNAVAWNWDFGDNNNSTLQNPTHSYASYGIYIVKLTMTTANGCTYQIARMVTINYLGPNGDPYLIFTDSVYPQTVNFYANTPGAISWIWDFGDSSATSTLENPSHSYLNAPFLNVTLITTDSICTDTISLELPAEPNPGISFGASEELMEIVMLYPKVGGCAPFEIEFKNGFTNSTWNFGDGTTSTTINPTHTYQAPGVYDLMEIGINDSGIVDTLLLSGYITIGGADAEFTTARIASCDSISIAFTDASVNAAQWTWSFGDGSTSENQNANHSYPPVNTTYPVMLIVTDTFGCSNTRLKSIYTGFDQPQLEYSTSACSGDTVVFTALVQNVVTWAWDFGDGMSSTDSVPAHIYSNGGTYGITLNTVDTFGCTLQFNVTDSITVEEPEANFTILSSGIGCDTVNVTFSNSSTSSTSYSWNFGDGTNSSLDSPVKLYDSPGQYSVTLTAYKAGCQDVQTYPNMVKVNTAVADFEYVQSGFCIPISVDLFDSSTAAISWAWDFGDGTTSTTQSMQNPTHTFVVAPTGDISLTIVDTNGCTASIAKSSIGKLEAAFTLNTAVGCAPLANSFTDGSTNAISWSWDFGDGSSSTISSPTHTYQDTGVFTVELIVESTAGCSDTLRIDDAVAVHRPVAIFTSLTAPDCAPSLVSFQSQSIDAASYYWSFGDASGSSNPHPGHIYIQPGDYAVNLAVTDSFGCSDTATPLVIQVLGPIANANASLSSGCEGVEISFTDSSINALTRSWSFGDGYSSSSASPDHNFENPGSYVVSLIVEDSIGCSSFYVFADSIFVYPTPQASFVCEDSVTCSPYESNLTNNSTGADAYLWTFDDGGTSTIAAPVHEFNAGSFEISLVASNDFGCIDTGVVDLIVKQSPSVNFSTSATDGCYPISIDFLSSVADTIDPTFFWQVGGRKSSDVNPTLSLEEIGFVDAHLTVTNSNGCTVSLAREDLIEVFDTLAPAGPTVKLVTVVSNSSIKVLWEEVKIADFLRYKVLRKETGSATYTTVAQLSGRATVQYIDENVNTLTTSYCYIIQTIDACENESYSRDLVTHCTIEVSAVTHATFVELNWTPYADCSIGGYEIYRSRKNAAMNVLISTVEPNVLTFKDTTIICSDLYSYRIIGTSICEREFRSLSDTTIAGPIENQFVGQSVDVIRSTVADNSSILTEWTQPKVAPKYVAQYKIYRSSNDGTSKYLTTVSSYQTSFMDDDVDITEETYQYLIEVENTCEVKNNPGGPGTSIMLQGEVIENFPVLEWTPYEGWESGVDHYEIQRKNDQGQWEVIKKVAPTNRKVIIEK